ncbi:hypothetical protein [Candidatus Poriferisodalis sp.]|uniref:hypothetical protein n=1 Tax=Candidatus Poriferisodalis sp. TaxID=3101277 RepID=UPI003B01E136
MPPANRHGDGYGRLTPSIVEIKMPPREGGVFFLDMDVEAVEWEVVKAALRRMPPATLSDASQMVFRSPRLRWRDSSEPVSVAGRGWPTTVDEMASSVESALVSHGLPTVAVGTVELPLAADPKTSAGVSHEVLARCRAVELDALLQSGNAIWRPTKYHYRLPSGHHTGAFVRIADVFRDHRAAPALGSWLHGCLRENIALVADSGTLMPIVQHLDHVLRLAARATEEFAPRGIAAVETLDSYPLSRFEYLERFSVFEEVVVLALLSVSSTGRTYRMIRDTLKETAGDHWRAECLVSRGDDQATSLPHHDALGRQSPWLALGEATPFLGQPGSCAICRQVDRARVVEIDPRSFAAMVLPQPTRIMPDVQEGRRNASLFETYQSHSPSTRGVRTDSAFDGVCLTESEAGPATASPTLRLPNHGVKFRMDALLRDPAVTQELVASRVAELEALPGRDRDRQEIADALQAVRDGQPAVAICAREQIALFRPAGVNDDAAMAQVLTIAQSVCPTVETAVVDDEFDAVASRANRQTSLLLVAPGVQSGATLQQLVVRVQNKCRQLDTPPEMHGLVVHAHPADRQTWRALRNTFRGPSGTARLLALWLTYLPRTSPFEEEFRVLRQFQEEWLEGTYEGTDALWQERLAWLDPDASAVESPQSPLWSPMKLQLRLTSLYGDLDDRHVLVAVGAAMQSALLRRTDEQVPEWVRFDLPNAFRSYFDGIIHASILRWTEPARAWWGVDDNECEALIGELKGRFEDDWKCLLPELLLAAAQGKVPQAGVDRLLEEACAQLRSKSWSPEVLRFVELGRILVEHLVPSPADESDDAAAETSG